MLRSLVCLFSLAVAFAQPPAPDPLNAAIQAVWQSRQNSGLLDTSLRDKARMALSQAPIESPQYAGWAQQIAQFYPNPAQSRAVLEEALARTGPLGKNSATRMDLLNALSDSWRQDRNLLQAVSYAEQAAAITPPPAATRPFRGVGVSFSGSAMAYSMSANSYTYRRLMDLYRQLGRPQDLAALVAKLAASGSNDLFLASLYEREGRYDEAARIYQRRVDEAANPQQSIGALQALSMFDQRQKQYDDAVSVLQKAIDTAAALPSSGGPGQGFWLRQDLARLLQQAGRTADADALYQQLLAESQGMPGNLHSQMVSNYAGYLGSTDRAAQGEAFLQTYLNDADLQPWEKVNAYYSLSNLARQSGNADRAEQYRQSASQVQRSIGSVEPPSSDLNVSSMLNDAFTAARTGRFDDALTLTLQAIAAAPSARDRYAVIPSASNVAMQLAAKAPDQAQRIFDRLLSAADSLDDANGHDVLYQNYARMLMSERRWPEASRAVERYRDALVADHGPGTGWLDQYYRLKIEVVRAQGDKRSAAAAAEDFLRFEAALNGDTSEPYLSALELAASAIEQNGSTDRALELYRRAVTVVDLTTTPADNVRRASIRGNAAQALARAGLFDDAESLARQAVALSGTASWHLQQVLKMKIAAEKAQAAR